MTLPHLIKYYKEYSEDSRLFKDNQHKTEFLVTTTYLEKYVRKGHKVLDIGSGPGVYSIFCAQQGSKVVAFDLSHKNLTELEDRIADTSLEENIVCHQGNAMDLSEFDDDSFDVVLNMGPIYHLKSHDEKVDTISESIRVLKPDGVLLVAYINKYFKFYQRIQRSDDPIKWEVMENIIQHGFKHDMDEAIFYFLFPREAEALFSNYSGKIKNHVTTDGNSYLFADAINSMGEDDFARYMRYHLEFCDDPHLLGSGLHNLIVFQKR